MRSAYQSFWFWPVLIFVPAIALGLTLPIVDEHLDPGFLLGPTRPSPSGARALLSAAATALGTILAIAFSMTMVSVQLAAASYSPRLLRRFMSDRTTQALLGSFVGSVAYLLLILMAVRSSGGNGAPAFVPIASLLVGLLFSLACLVLVVVYLHHTSRSVQVATIVATVANETAAVVGRGGEGCGAPTLPEDHAVLRSKRAGYVEIVDHAALLRELPDAIVVARVDARPGSFAFAGVPLLSYWPAAEVDEAALARAFALGRERTLEEDPLFGVRQLVDVALKALSPALNDPTTAEMVVNELAAIAATVIERWSAQPRWSRLARGGTSLYWRQHDVEGFLEEAYGELVPAAAAYTRVTTRIIETLVELCRGAPPAARELLRAWGNAAAHAWRTRAPRSAGERSHLEASVLRLDSAALLH